MSVADKLQELAQDISAAYTKISAKGGTVPQNKNTNNLADAIDSISGGAQPYYTNHGTVYFEVMNITIAEGDGFLQNAYRYATQLKELYATNLAALWVAAGYVFQGCTALQKAELPIYGQIGLYFFGGCTALKSVKLGYKSTDSSNTYFIGANAFNGCSVFDTLVLSGDKLCTLGNVNAFTNTPFRGSGGTVYVPSSLKSTYEADTNWSALESCTFAAIEDNIAALEAKGINVDEFKGVSA